MRLLLLFTVIIQQWILGTAQTKDGSALQNIGQGIKTAAASAIGAINSQLLPVTASILPVCIEPPKECPNSNVTFWLYTKDRRNNPIELSINNASALDAIASKVNVKNPWKIIIHGYTKSRFEIPNPELQAEYFRRGDYNLISVDYAPLARDHCYISAVENVPIMSSCTAQIIEALVEKQYFTLPNLHVIGFSLGAQIAGRIHEFLQDGKPGRVTGLDPASPLFDGVANPQISKKSGDFVDIVHTNGLFKGQVDALGHIDFYPNGGSIQPGCLTSTCHHDRSPLYYAESINSDKGFWGISCTSYLTFLAGKCNTHVNALVKMGEHIDKKNRGIFYLQTSSTNPFALGQQVKALPVV